jgi:uncharacterized protein YkwD
MGGAHQFAILPLMAGALLALGCGVPIAPEYVAATSTAQAIEQRQNTNAQLSGQGGPDLRTTSTGLAGASAVETTPLPTREANLPGDDEEPDTTATPAVEATLEATPAAAAVATAPPAPVTSESFTQEFVGLLNALRSGRGLGSLGVNGTMTSAANAYAAYMGSANFFGHSGLDGSSPRSRLTAAGYRGSYKGEALSAGQTTPQAALNTLLASPPHAAILLEPTAVELGVGYAYQAGSTYGHYWVVITGVP